MSDSSLSRDGPDDETLETELRQVVHRIYSIGNLDNLTVKRVRSLAENNLSLQDGFFKGPDWKSRSKAVIETEATNASKSAAEDSSPVKPKKNPRKRGSSDSPQPPKRQRKSADLAEDSDAADSAPRQAGAERKRPQQKIKSEETEAEAASPAESFADGFVKSEDADRTTAIAAQSESELSEVLDDEPKPKPKPKPRKKKTGAQDAKPSPDEPKKRGRKCKDKAADADPDAEEIKRLQGWLVKCGIRKMWARELKPYDTPKAKIRHLREMLADAGMTGRYSVEKASQIREARELQADLEAVTAQEKRWGKSAEEADDARPPRRLAKGLEGLDFSDSDSD